jgi:hypothetical protein
MQYIQSTTATQRFSTVSAKTIAPGAPERDGPTAAEYGCVDWYPYMATLDERTEWFDHDQDKDSPAASLQAVA